MENWIGTNAIAGDFWMSAVSKWFVLDFGKRVWIAVMMKCEISDLYHSVCGVSA